ncbi:hypothetical protein [Clostridium uliginosum]|uniref:Uncharacterized protein n=1 Tax=Clostridium uliginosum TaxID=119641 RepID=A0A1I1JNN6_9CLOT|nr:hypothetical protein [Clostridium uliginosum]SFC50086.1 hypothetical protein SAMN05421842_104104 [Clostridium uliginosum]
MNKEKIPDNQTQRDYTQEEMPEMHSSENSTSNIGNFKALYPSTLKAGYRPSAENVECANGLNPSILKPGPSDFKKFKRLYLPNSKANYQPTEERIEQANGLKSSKPNTLF